MKVDLLYVPMFHQNYIRIADEGGFAIRSDVSSKLKKISFPTNFFNLSQSLKNLFILFFCIIVVAILEAFILRVLKLFLFLNKEH